MRIDSTDRNIQYAYGIASLTCFNARRSKGFDNTVHEIRDELLKVDPYLIQEGRYKKVPGEGVYSYLLIPTFDEYGRYIDFDDLEKEDGEVRLIEEVYTDSELLDYIQIFDPNDESPYVVLIDGDSYHQETIEALPNQENVFVLFSPYNATKTMPVFEAKKYASRKSSHEQQGQKFARVRMY